MSSTGRMVDRIDQDNYPTPDWCVERLLEACPVPQGALYEPFAGNGDIIQAASRVLPPVVYPWCASELREDARAPLELLLGPDNVYIGDALRTDPFEARGEFAGIISNPPYEFAYESLLTCLMRARFVALLLRLNFLGSEERADFWQRFPPDVYILPNRPCFHVFIKDAYRCAPCRHTASVEEGALAPMCAVCGQLTVFHKKVRTTSDSTEYAWFVYPDGVRAREAGTTRVLATTPLAVRRAAVNKLLAQQGRLL